MRRSHGSVLFQGQEEAEAQTGKVAKVQLEATGVQFLD